MLDVGYVVFTCTSLVHDKKCCLFISKGIICIKRGVVAWKNDKFLWRISTFLEGRREKLCNDAKDESESEK